MACRQAASRRHHRTPGTPTCRRKRSPLPTARQQKTSRGRAAVLVPGAVPREQATPTPSPAPGGPPWADASPSPTPAPPAPRPAATCTSPTAATSPDWCPDWSVFPVTQLLGVGCLVGVETPLSGRPVLSQACRTGLLRCAPAGWGTFWDPRAHVPVVRNVVAGRAVTQSDRFQRSSACIGQPTVAMVARLGSDQAPGTSVEVSATGDAFQSKKSW